MLNHSIEDKLMNQLRTTCPQAPDNSLEKVVNTILTYERERYIDIPKFNTYIIQCLERAKSKVGDIVKYVETILQKVCYEPFVSDKKIGKVVTDLLNSLHQYEFTGTYAERLLIEEVEVHSLLEFPITAEDMDRTNIAIIQYCADRDEMTYKHFLDYLLKSKVMKRCSPPLALLEKKCNEFAQKYSEFNDL